MYRQSGFLKRTRENLVLLCVWKGKTTTVLNKIGLKRSKGSMGMQKYIVFDFDGTLVDSQNTFVPIYNQIAKSTDIKR